MWSGRVWTSNMTIVLRAGPGVDIPFAGRVQAASGLIIQFAGRAGPGLHNCCGSEPGLGLKSYLRAGPGPTFQARAVP